MRTLNNDDEVLYCKHGQRIGGEESGAVLWNGPVGLCECCRKRIFYADTASVTTTVTAGVSTVRWTHTSSTRCPECGGLSYQYDSSTGMMTT